MAVRADMNEVYSIEETSDKAGKPVYNITYTEGDKTRFLRFTYLEHKTQVERLLLRLGYSGNHMVDKVPQ